MVILEIPRRKCNPYISFVLRYSHLRPPSHILSPSLNSHITSGLRHTNLAEFHGILEDPSLSALSPKINTKHSSPLLKHQSSESYNSDFDDEEEGEKYENGVKRESFADFISALGQRVSLKGGITQNMKSLVNRAPGSSPSLDRRNGSLYRNIDSSSSNENEVFKVVMENIPNVCNLRGFLHSPAENADMYLSLKLFYTFFSSSRFF